MHDADRVDHPWWSRTLASRRDVWSNCSRQKREFAAMPRPPHPQAQEEAKQPSLHLLQHSAGQLANSHVRRGGKIRLWVFMKPEYNTAGLR